MRNNFALRKASALAVILILLTATVAQAAVAINRDSSRAFVSSGYDSYPAVVRSGTTDYMFYCRPGTATDGWPGDAIYLRTRPASGGSWGSPTLQVRARGTGFQDSNHVCDPTVVSGVWNVNNTTYNWAMYYTANDRSDGNFRNQIFVAFTNNLTNWTTAYRPSTPVVSLTSTENSQNSYGIGQASAYKTNSTSGVRLYFLYATNATGNNNYFAQSTNGTTFGSRTKVTNCGTDTTTINADYMTDPSTGYVYRAESNTHLGSDRITLLRINANAIAAGGTTRWQGVGYVDIGNSGEPVQNNPGFVRDANGNIILTGGTARMFWGAGQLDSGTWDIQGGTFSTTSGWVTQPSMNC